MAKRKQYQRSSKVNQSSQKSTHKGLFLQIGIGLVMLGVLAFGAVQLLDGGDNQTTSRTTSLPADNDGLEATSLETGRNLEAVAVEPVTDRETRYLGPASDPATLALAEAGELGQPTLVFFHADW